MLANDWYDYYDIFFFMQVKRNWEKTECFIFLVPVARLGWKHVKCDPLKHFEVKERHCWLQPLIWVHLAFFVECFKERFQQFKFSFELKLQPSVFSLFCPFLHFFPQGLFPLGSSKLIWDQVMAVLLCY